MTSANGESERNGKLWPLRVTFGQLAVRKGYASSEEVDEALRIQRSLNEQTGKHKPIGLIMLEMGVLGTTELIDVLKEMSESPGAVTSVMRRADRHAIRGKDQRP